MKGPGCIGKCGIAYTGWKKKSKTDRSKILQGNHIMTTIDEILSDPNFLKLDKELARFNIFHATDMKNREIKHTKFMGYLLDPNESHRLGTQFLWGFLRRLAANGVSGLNLIDLDLEYTKVTIEHNLGGNGRIDLLLEIPKSNELLVIAIENKIQATQSPDQLKNYREKINKQFQGIKKFIYLTLNDEEPDDNEEWINVTYGNTVAPAIIELISESEETLSTYLKCILQDYIEIIKKDEEKTDKAFEFYELTKEEVKRKVRAIKKPKIHSPEYKLQLLYPRAFDYIRSYDDDPRLKILKEFRTIFGSSENHALKLESSSRKYLEFSILDSNVENFLINGICSSTTTKGQESKRNIYFQIEARINPENTRSVLLSTRLYLGPTNENFSLRSEICSKIRHEFDQEPIKNAGPIYTRIKNFETIETTIEKSESILKDIKCNYEKESATIKSNINRALRFFVKENKETLLAIGISEEILRNLDENNLKQEPIDN